MHPKPEETLCENIKVYGYWRSHEDLKGLEALSIDYGLYLNDSITSILNEKVMLKLKHLRIETWFRDLDTKTARKIVNNFGNLESLTIIAGGNLPERSVKILLRGLKNLKEINLIGFKNHQELDQEKFLDYVRIYGKKLRKLQVVGKGLNIVI